MKTLLKPQWIFVFVILPQVLLAVLYSSSVSIIHSLLSDWNIQMLTYFGYALGGGVVGFALYGSACLASNKKVHGLPVGLLLLFFYSAFLISYSNLERSIIPWEIPQWMIDGDDLFKYVIACVMPSLVYGILLLILYFTPEGRTYKAWKNFASMAAIPFFWYIAFMVIVPLLHQFKLDNKYLFIMVFATSTIAFLFFLIRWVYILIMRRDNVYEEYYQAVKIIFALILPLIGLLVNMNDMTNNLFGNFSHWGFYLIAFLNGVLFCIPIQPTPKVNLLLFFLKAVTLSYTFYFFLVFLPFLPLAVLAVLAVGLGFLMLTPSVLFVIHIHELHLDFTHLKTHYRAWKLNLLVVAGFLVVPGIITLNYLSDRDNLHKALDYVYEPNYNNQEEFDISSVSKLLKHIHANKENNFSFNQSKTPYLSPYYNWLVLDNLTLSNEKLQLLEKLYLGKSETKVFFLGDNVKDPKVRLTQWKTHSEYDSKNKCWKTWMDLEIKNEQEQQGEYISKIHLPQGCWISNYYLNVGGEKKYGLLAEKKTAQWIYNQIRSERRDPGILYYVGANEVLFRVFPFGNQEERRTGIEFMHYEPLQLQIDGHDVHLGDPTSASSSYQSENYIYLTAKEKERLPKITRQPYVHFIVDCSNPEYSSATKPLKATFGAGEEPEVSQAKEEKIKSVGEQIEHFYSKNLITPERALISFTDYKTRTFKLQSDWRKSFKESDFVGGFFPERTMKEALVNNYLSKSDTYPVFVIISDNFEERVSTNSIRNIPYTCPEGGFYYVLSEGKVNQYSLREMENNKPLKEDVQGISSPQVHVWQGQKGLKAYLPIDGEGAIIIKDLKEITDKPNGKTAYEKALDLHAMDIKMNLMPKETTNLWLPIIRGSFLSKIMTPQTAYLVVENEAQEKALLAKQKQTLAAKNSLDLDEEIRMSEPELWVVLAFLGAFLLWSKRKKLVWE